MKMMFIMFHCKFTLKVKRKFLHSAACTIYPLGLHKVLYTLLHGILVQLNTSLRRFQPCCSIKCVNTFYAQISFTIYSQVLIHTVESTGATWNEQTCQMFDTTP